MGSKVRSGRRWTRNQRRLIQWLAMPEGTRKPKDLAELAEVLNLKPETLDRWQGDPGLIHAAYEVAEYRLSRRVTDLLEVIGSQAMTGDYRFVKLVLDLTAHYRIDARSGEGFKFDKDARLRFLGERAKWEEERRRELNRVAGEQEAKQDTIRQGRLWQDDV